MNALYATIDIPDWLVTYFEKSAYQDPQRYIQHSPIYDLLTKKTPVFIQHGGLDPRVPVSQARLLQRELVSRNVTVKYMEYPNEGHVLGLDKNRKNSMEDNISWFKKYLQK